MPNNAIRILLGALTSFAIACTAMQSGESGGQAASNLTATGNLSAQGSSSGTVEVYLALVSTASITDDSCRMATTAGLPGLTVYVGDANGEHAFVSDENGTVDLGTVTPGTYTFRAPGLSFYFDPSYGYGTTAGIVDNFVVPTSIPEIGTAVELPVLLDTLSGGACPGGDEQAGTTTADCSDPRYQQNVASDCGAVTLVGGSYSCECFVCYATFDAPYPLSTICTEDPAAIATLGSLPLR